MRNDNKHIIPEYPFKTSREWHVYHVFNDPDFGRKVRKLNKDYQILGYHHGHIGTAEAIGARYKKIRDEYRVTDDDISFYMGELHLHGSVRRDIKHSIMFNMQEDKFKAEYGADITKEEFLESWNYIQRTREIRDIAKSKRKPPENTQLVYAIFKARKNHTFADIFRLYSEGKLPFYAHQPVYDSEEVLESFYNKHKPKPTI